MRSASTTSVIKPSRDITIIGNPAYFRAMVVTRLSPCSVAMCKSHSTQAGSKSSIDARPSILADTVFASYPAPCRCCIRRSPSAGSGSIIKILARSVRPVRSEGGTLGSIAAVLMRKPLVKTPRQTPHRSRQKKHLLLFYH